MRSNRTLIWVLGTVLALAILVVLLWFVYPGPQIRDAMNAPTPVASPAPAIVAPVDQLMPATGADLRECANGDAKVTFENIVGPLKILGKDLGSAANLSDNWLFVSDPKAQAGWIPQGAVTGTIDLVNIPDKDGTCTSPTKAPAATVAPVTEAPAIQAPKAATSDPYAGFTACPYKDTGSSQPEKVDVATFKLDGQVVYAVDLSKLPGCAIVFEGRTPWQKVDLAIYGALGTANIKSPSGTDWDQWNLHLIIDVRSALGKFDPTLRNADIGRSGGDTVPTQYQGWFTFLEGSFWFYDPTWNISDIKQAKPSIAQELEVKKFRDAMKPGEYNYPRIIMQPNGSMFIFWQHDSGDAAYTNGIAAGCTKSAQPELIPVYGLWDGKQFSAAIGAGNCKMAYWADGTNDAVVWHGYQKDGKTIVSYNSSVIAYMFPAIWTDDQVTTWITAHPGGK